MKTIDINPTPTIIVPMLTKNQIKSLKSLKDKKTRTSEGLFAIEGIKSIRDLNDSANITIEHIYCTEATVDHFRLYEQVDVISDEQLRQISSQTNPEGAFAVCHIPKHPTPNIHPDKLYIALDDLRDPGNLGTIIRLAHWFGVEDIFCSLSTVDAYNPKVVQSTMGSLGYVRVHYVDLPSFLSQCELPIWGTFLEGENIYTSQISPKGIIVIGNEANGISPQVEAVTTKKITIPHFSSSKKAESLNAAMATSIVLSEFVSHNFHE